MTEFIACRPEVTADESTYDVLDDLGYTLIEQPDMDIEGATEVHYEAIDPETNSSIYIGDNKWVPGGKIIYGQVKGSLRDRQKIFKKLGVADQLPDEMIDNIGRDEESHEIGRGQIESEFNGDLI